MREKSPDAYRTISEAGEEAGLPPHVLRFWESKFAQLKPIKRAGGRRMYRPQDILLLKGLRRLLYNEGYTIKGAQKYLREHGVAAVSSLSDEAVASASPVPAEPVEVPASQPVSESSGSEEAEAGHIASETAQDDARPVMNHSGLTADQRAHALRVLQRLQTARIRLNTVLPEGV